MSKEGRKIIKNLELCAEKAGVTITDIVHGAKHTKVYLMRGDRRGMTVVAGDSKDPRALLNIACNMKHAVNNNIIRRK